MYVVNRAARTNRLLERLERSRVARECAKLEPALEKALADEGRRGELAEWPEY